MNNAAEVLFEELPAKKGKLGVITLNRPQVLNALNQSMCNLIHQQLQQWEENNSIKAVIIRAAEGRAFCAGGDIRNTYDRKMKNDPTLPTFFRDEYRLNRYIHHYPKPYIALLDGITMGGGAGISIHGSHRVATERLVFAMPETAIGFFPDIGASYFLSRLPFNMGIYLGLTGARITYQDCLALKLATQFIPQAKLNNLMDALVNADLENNAKENVTYVLNQLKADYGTSTLLTQQKEIQTCFAKDSVEDIIKALENSTEWCQPVATGFKSKSPTSLKVTLQALKKGEQLEFDRCMQMEFRLANRFINSHDFFEGIRAVVIDKDQTPHWQPARLADVSTEEISAYFQPLEEELV